MLNPGEIIKKRPNEGFTLVEVIAVLVILAVLSAVALSRGIATDKYSVASEAAILKNHLRFAQIKAMSDITNKWGITISSGSYSLQSCTSSCSASSQTLPGENSATHTFSGVSGPSTSTTIIFDSWGIPVNTSGNAVTPPTITLTSTTSTQSANIAVSANTGFIQ